ncbi:MAG: hypothetical protein ACJAV1_001887 [Paraglaciecola sp.]
MSAKNRNKQEVKNQQKQRQNVFHVEAYFRDFLDTLAKELYLSILE